MQTHELDTVYERGQALTSHVIHTLWDYTNRSGCRVLSRFYANDLTESRTVGNFRFARAVSATSSFDFLYGCMPIWLSIPKGEGAGGRHHWPQNFFIKSHFTV